MPDVELLPGLRVAAVDVDAEASLVSELIRQCYDHLQPSAETVKGWTSHPTFASDLWIWKQRLVGAPAVMRYLVT